MEALDEDKRRKALHRVFPKIFQNFASRLSKKLHRPCHNLGKAEFHISESVQIWEDIKHLSLCHAEFVTQLIVQLLAVPTEPLFLFSQAVTAQTQHSSLKRCKKVSCFFKSFILNYRILAMLSIFLSVDVSPSCPYTAVKPHDTHYYVIKGEHNCFFRIF